MALEADEIKSIMENGLEAAVFGGISVKTRFGLAVAWGKLKIGDDKAR